MSKIFEFADVTRVTVVGPRRGIEFEQYDLYKDGVELHLQDDGRTLKLLPAQAAEPRPLMARCGIEADHTQHTFWDVLTNSRTGCDGIPK